MKRKIIVGTAVGLVTGAAVYSLSSYRRKQKRVESTDGSSALSASDTNHDSSRQSASNTSEHFASMGRNENGEVGHAIDDQGTNQSEAAEIIRYIRDHAFKGSNENLAIALGRSSEEVEKWTNGSEEIDGDGLMKARALAINRGLEEISSMGE